jgi:DNA-binding FadR family transcriptional regulator
MLKSDFLLTFLNSPPPATHEESGAWTPVIKASVKLGVSLASLREQLEVARALGLVEIKPRLGMKRRLYSFTPAVTQSLGYALALNNEHFRKYAELRNHVEAAFWYQAVQKLTDEDKQELQGLVARFPGEIAGTPIQVPHKTRICI